MSKLSSPGYCCSVSFFLFIVVSTIITFVHGQEKNGEFKHELPEGVELVDPKSLGLTDVDLSKFLGNVKVLGGGQVGDTKTQILTVGFEGDENINFNDFEIPGLTNGNSSLPHKEKEIADMAFKKFKEFFEDPTKANQFEDAGKNLGLPVYQKQEPNKNGLTDPLQKNPIHIQLQHHHPQQYQIPVIQKPYLAPNTQLFQLTTQHPSRYVTPPPPLPLPMPLRQPEPHFPPVQININQSPQHAYNDEIKPQQPIPLEFGARIPVSPNPQNRHTKPSSNSAPQNVHISHGEEHLQKHLQQTSLPPRVVHQSFPQQQPQVHIIQHPAPNPQQFNQNQQQRVNLPSQPPSPRVPRVNPLQMSPPPPPVSFSPQTFNQLQQTLIPHINSQQGSPPVQGRIVRNQLLQPEHTTHQETNTDNSYYTPQSWPLPPQQHANYPSASNQIPIHSQQSPSTATSHVYIHRGPKAVSSVQHTSFHPSFQPPARMAKDFTPLSISIASTDKPESFDVTPSMQLIPISTNENAITDPARMLQLRQYQKHKHQQNAESSNSEQIILPQHQASVASTTMALPTTTTPISITTSYPEIESNHHQHDFDSSINYQSLDHNSQVNQISNDFNKESFSLHTQQQQHQLHILQQQKQPTVTTQNLNNGQVHHQYKQQFIQAHHHQLQPQPQTQTVFYNQDQKRPPRHGPPNRPRFQFHLTHQLGQPLRIQMNPDPKTILNTIRRKRGYRRLSNLFNRMFRWDRS